MNLKLARLLTIVGLLALVSTAAASADEGLSIRASLSGFNEVTPKATFGIGSFKAKVKDDEIAFTLTYSRLTTPAFMAHLHFGQPGVTGGIFVWLCGAAPPPAQSRPCKFGNTTEPETVTGTIKPSDIVSPVPDQDVNPGDFATALRIIESGDAYVNVHTSRFGAGEIRGQVAPGESD